MDTSSLKYFMVVAQMQHMSRAAEQLNITQPSLSASIKRLESEIGYQLFDRTKHGIQLNEYGHIFLNGIMESESIMSACMTEMETLKKASMNLVRLSCSNSPSNARLIDLLLSEGMNLKVSDISHNWEQDLLNKTCDMVITMGILHKKRIARLCLSEQKMVFVVGSSHPLATVSSLSLDDLLPYSFCSTDAPHSLLNVTLEQHPLPDFRPHIAFLGRNSADMLKAIQTGRFIGLMVRRNLPPDKNLHVLPVTDFDITLPIYLYWRESDSQNKALSSLRQNILDFYQSLPE